MTTYWRDIPYSKGFVLTKDEFVSVAHFEKKLLPEGWYLWSDRATNTESAFSRSNEDFVILRGHWVDTSDDASSQGTAQRLLNELRKCNFQLFHRRLAKLGGRYIVIVNHASNLYVYNDATGLRSVYYSTISPTASSHLNLLVELFDERASYTSKATMRALDATPFCNLRQLLPNFRLILASNAVERFFPFEENRFVGLTEDERLTLVENIWRRLMRFYLSATDKLTLSITGGLDSKLMVAMCGTQANKFDGYTYGVERKEDARSESLSFDVAQVKKLLPYLNLRSHEFINITHREPLNEDLRELINKNTWGNHGPYLVPIYRDMFPGDGWYHLRGTGVEIIRRYWPYKSEGLDALLRPLRHAEGPKLDDRARQLGYDKDQYGYDLMDLIYWEIRMGKWHAEILNEQDAAFETFLPISVREIYEILLSFPEWDRESAHTVFELINRNNPLLNFWGANDARNIYEKWRDETRVPPVTTVTRRGIAERLTFPSITLLIPKDDFRKNNGTERVVCVSPSLGVLTMMIDQPYRKKAGEGYFEWRVKVDGATVVRCDGAVTEVPSSVTIRNIPKEARISIELYAHRNGSLTSDSWERASRTCVHGINFYSKAEDATSEFRVGTDNPYAEVLVNDAL